MESVFIIKASTENSAIFFASDWYQLAEKQMEGDIVYDVYHKEKIVFENLPCQLKGHYQKKNIPGVLMTIDHLKPEGFIIPDLAVRDGIANVVSLTGLKGRWQKLNDSPLMICDTGHNEDGIREVVRQIRAIHYNQLHIVWGSVKDKDISRMLALLPVEATYYFCEAKIPRALPARELESKARKMGLKGEVIEEVNDAIARAKAKASPGDFIFIGGSTFVVAEIENL